VWVAGPEALDQGIELFRFECKDLSVPLTASERCQEALLLRIRVVEPPCRDEACALPSETSHQLTIPRREIRRFADFVVDAVEKEVAELPRPTYGCLGVMRHLARSRHEGNLSPREQRPIVRSCIIP
jgi:hypothetical protein